MGERDNNGLENISTTVGTIFLAELEDKTQLAAILMTSKTGKPLSVFIGAAPALSLVTAIGVVFGEGLISMIPQNILKKCPPLRLFQSEP